MTRFDDVVSSWDQANVTHIHPLRGLNETAYWQSGVHQAHQAAREIPEGATVVDFGCGEGRVTLPLARMGFQVIAVDASVNMLNRLRTRIKGKNLPIKTMKSDGTNLSDRLKNVDAVVCRAVLIHHDHSDVSVLVHQFAKILKPGGVLVCDWPTGPHHVRRDWIDVTTFTVQHRLDVAAAAGLELVHDDTPSVWVKKM